MAFDFEQPAYKSLRGIIAERTKPVIAWIGAGLSVPAGLPTWPTLQNRLVQSVRDRARTMDENGRREFERRALAAAQEKDLWAAMSILKSLGPESFVSEVRDALRSSDTAPIPENYLKLWQLNIRGIINLNIDRLAVRSFQDARQRELLSTVGNRELRLAFPKLRANQPFVVQLHGALDDAHSWVFTHQELNSLQADPTYPFLVQNCLASTTVMFVGITTDDPAIRPHLQFLKKLGIEIDCFWFTHKSDAETDRWAEDNLIRVIRYSEARNHAELTEALDGMVTYIPDEPEDFAPVVDIGGAQADYTLPSESDLMKLDDANEVRMALNAHAQKLLAINDANAYERFSNFCREYEEAVDRAYFVTSRAPKNKLLSYTLERMVEEGAFGKVFEATDASGTRVAVKVLHERVRDKDGFLKSFRRGVNSMRILESEHCEGMVRFFSASEIPAFVAMEWIEGPTLKNAVEAGSISDWTLLLRIARELSETLKNAHSLPQRVLHRDIRPTNIMLKNFYIDPDDWKTVLLDFDLSWHRGATEESVAYSPYAGYLAPEQVVRIPGVSTRNAAVDSFGLGMTLFYMLYRHEPQPGMAFNPEWERTVRDACNRIGGSRWKSLPERFARVILGSTRKSQHERWDMAQIHEELRLLTRLNEEDFSDLSADQLCEEIVCRSRVGATYRWNPDRAEAQTGTIGGLEIVLRGDDARGQILLAFHWSSTGSSERASVRKYVFDAGSRIVEKLRAAGWSEVVLDKGDSQLHVSASIETDLALQSLDGLAAALDNAAASLRIS